MKIRTVFAMSCVLISTGAAQAGPPAKITDLGWMTGTWAAPVGPNSLEENWISAANGGIAAMVRMGGPNGIAMWEVITIEEKGGTLNMTLQQWGSGFEPRTPQPQKLELAEIGDRHVMFKAVTEGSIATLGYTRRGDDTFTIEMTPSKGAPIKVDLKGHPGR